MSELTNEKLEEYARDGRNAGDVEVEQMARELLALRTRDAGDDEGIDREVLDEYDWIAQFGIYSTMSEERIEGVKRLAKLRDIAITRGQTRTDAVNKAAEWARECEGLREQIVTLTTERDEARSKLEKQIDITYEAKAVVSQMQKELAALKSCPAMAEVDALVAKWNEPGPWEPEVVSEALREYETLTRRSISSREVVIEGLLAVESLILESKGVAGLHLNGDLAEWDELRSGGRFGDWLYKFDDALEIVKGK